MLHQCCVQSVMREFPEARMAYGESDEYSFILHKDTQLYGECSSTWLNHAALAGVAHYNGHPPQGGLSTHHLADASTATSLQSTSNVLVVALCSRLCIIKRQHL